MTNEPLKPCPFCGGTKLTFRPGFMSREVTHIILCLNCDISAGEYHTLPELIEAWNNRPNPWTTITADPATLPPSGKEVMLSIWRKGKGHVISARWHAKQWLASGGYVVQELDGIPYAWQPWPTSAPYPSAETEQP